ncbi:MAG: hypothetical protein N0C84_17095 [Candidatus Thiodiazotropha taylori]|uniref:Uncharacterized protein n=1 Tax=Candidatus Thiodiazotropha taylori TaxID=2792791 RepID=A0A9E4T1X1_9GAMM|nr:hypothetical protein [Candidatus Thiodiazotropha taylori]MCW4258184.1 hypothetical protein [Candidatus Thiodiazotropha taylori]
MSFEPKLEREYQIDFVRPGDDQQHHYIKTKSIEDAEAELKLMRKLPKFDGCDIRIAEIETTVRWMKYS